MKKGFIIISIVFCAIIANAQQIGMYSHYFYNPLVYNPAFTGSGGAVNAMLISRSQWNDFKGAPKLTVFTLDGSLIPKKVGLGLSLINDRKGISDRTGGYLSYSYRININADMHVSLGLSLGIINQTLDFTKVFVENTSDPILFADLQRKTTFDGNAGLVFVWKDVELGAAVPQIIGNKVNYVDNYNVRAYYTQSRHYMASLKYKYFIAKEKGISIAPQGLVRFVANTPFQYDGNINLDWNSKFWVGATYKSDYAVAANVGFCLHKQLFLGYSYDFIIGNIGKYSGMSQEILIHFKFGERKKTEVVAETKPVEKNEPSKNADYEKLIESMQGQLNESEKKIKELDDKIALQAKVQNTEPAVSGEDSESASDLHTGLNPDLNTLILQQLLKKIELILENPNASHPEVQELRNEAAAFIDTKFTDRTMEKVVKKQVEVLSEPIGEVVSVMVNGVVVLENGTPETDYSTISISVLDKGSNKTIGTYTPNAKTGKYLLILTPGRKYLISSENKGYQPYFRDFSTFNSKASYEMPQEIKLKVETK